MARCPLVFGLPASLLLFLLLPVPIGRFAVGTAQWLLAVAGLPLMTTDAANPNGDYLLFAWHTFTIHPGCTRAHAFGLYFSVPFPLLGRVYFLVSLTAMDGQAIRISGAGPPQMTGAGCANRTEVHQQHPCRVGSRTRQKELAGGESQSARTDRTLGAGRRPG